MHPVFSEDDVVRITANCSSLGIVIQEKDDSENEDFIVFIGTFRHVRIELKIAAQKNPHPCENNAFHEVEMRNYEQNEFNGCTVWREAFAIDETVKGLDVLSFHLNDSIVYGVIHEKELCRANVLIDGLSAKCPMDPPLKDILFLLRGTLTLIKWLHTNDMAGCGPLKNFLLSERKDGHGKKAAAWVRHDDRSFVLLLGDAVHVQMADYEYHSRTCPTITSLKTTSGPAKRSRKGVSHKGPQQSGRQFMKNCSMSDIKGQLTACGKSRALTDTAFSSKGNLSCCEGSVNNQEVKAGLKD
jgi:hypothetical protein